MPTTIPIPAGQIGLGTTLGYAFAADSTYASVGDIIDLDGPSITVGEVEAKKLSSTFKPFLPTIPEGEASFTIQHNSGNAQMQTLRNACKVAPVPFISFKVTYPDGGFDVFPGFLKGYKVAKVSTEELITAELMIRITGPVVSTYPA